LLPFGWDIRGQFPIPVSERKGWEGRSGTAMAHCFIGSFNLTAFKRLYLIHQHDFSSMVTELAERAAFMKHIEWHEGDRRPEPLRLRFVWKVIYSFGAILGFLRFSEPFSKMLRNSDKKLKIPQFRFLWILKAECDTAHGFE
jgi:hypothetical protein